MSKFEDNLWDEVRGTHGADLAHTPAHASHTGRRLRPRLLAGTGLGLAGAGTVAALVLGAAGSTPAFAVTRNHDGTFTVVIRRIEAIHDANARLAALGIRARAVQITSACVGPGRNWVSVHGPQVTTAVTPAPGAVVQATIDPHQIPAGRTLVLAAGHTRAGQRVLGAATISGVAPVCVAKWTRATRVVAPPPGAHVTWCRVLLPTPSTTATGTGTSTSGTGTGTTGTGTTASGTPGTGTGTTGTGTGTSTGTTSPTPTTTTSTGTTTGSTPPPVLQVPANAPATVDCRRLPLPDPSSPGGTGTTGTGTTTTGTGTTTTTTTTGTGTTTTGTTTTG